MAHHGAAPHHDAIGHGSADAEYLETPPGAEYEHTDASVGTIVKFGFWLALVAVLVHFGLGLMYGFLVEQAQDLSQPRYPLAAQQQQPLPPEPRLQQFPRNEIYAFRVDEEKRLHSYGWVDKDGGTVHIPIEDAMRMTLERGLPSRAQDSTQPVATPGMLASDSSSGRVMERRRE